MRCVILVSLYLGGTYPIRCEWPDPPLVAGAMMDVEPESPSDETASLPPWKASPGWWLRRVAAPLLAIAVIVGAIVWLQAPESSSDRRTARANEPLESDTEAPQEGSAAPPIQLATLNGADVSLSDYLGKLVVLNFWATWCGPCREEMPLFEQVQQALWFRRPCRSCHQRP